MGLKFNYLEIFLPVLLSIHSHEYREEFEEHKSNAQANCS